jgi:hypothetical protein
MSVLCVSWYRFGYKIKSSKKFVELENCGHAPIEEPGISQLQTAISEFLENIN